MIPVPNTVLGLRPELHETFRMVRTAFPDEIPEEAYRPLLALLAAGMSQRAAARVVAYCTGREYPLVYHDVLGAVSPYDPDPLDPAQVEAVRQRLREHGYDDWLAKEE